MLRFQLVRLASALSIAAALPALAQVQGNPLPLHNGADVLYLPSGTAGDLYWKVYPRELMNHPSGQLHLVGQEIELYDTDWTTPAQIYDQLLSRALPSATSPGNLVPDLADPGAVLLLGGSSGFPNPCLISPALCSGGCPIAGLALGYHVSMQLPSGILLSANGTRDYALTAFVPPAGGPSACAPTVPDQSLMTGASVDETQADWLGTGYSAYGGFQLGSSSVFVPDAVSQTTATTLRFAEPLAESAGFAPGAAQPLPGLELLHTSVSASAGLPYTQIAVDAGGAAHLAAVASSLAPLLPAPGIPLFGASWRLDPSDPTVLATLKTGGFAPLGGLMLFHKPVGPLPAGVVGLALSSQALSLDPVTQLAASSNVLRTHFEP